MRQATFTAVTAVTAEVTAVETTMRSKTFGGELL
jgi:hypothetical protein